MYTPQATLIFVLCQIESMLDTGVSNTLRGCMYNFWSVFSKFLWGKWEIQMKITVRSRAGTLKMGTDSDFWSTFLNYICICTLVFEELRHFHSYLAHAFLFKTYIGWFRSPKKPLKFKVLVFRIRWATPPSILEE